MAEQLSRGQLAEIDAGVRPAGALNSITFDGGIESGALSAAAVLTTVLTGTNNDLVFTADSAGTAGNDITVEYRDPGIAGQAIDAYMTSATDIVCDLETSVGVVATSTVTQSTADLSDGETLTIGTTVYRFKDTMAQAYDVQIGVDVATTLDNFKAAINATGTPGTEYFAGTLIHPDVTATTNAATTQVIDAKVKGVAGNLIATTSTAGNYAWTSTLMASGEDVGQILSLASEVTTEIETIAAATALIDITNSGGDDATGVVTAMAQSSLSGGSDGKVPLFTVTGGIICSLRGYCETALTGASGTLVHGITGDTNMVIPSIVITTIDPPKGIDSTGLVAHGTALASTPLWYVQDEDVFATTGTTAAGAGIIHYVLDFIAITEGATVTPA